MKHKNDWTEICLQCTYKQQKRLNRDMPTMRIQTTTKICTSNAHPNREWHNTQSVHQATGHVLAVTMQSKRNCGQYQSSQRRWKTNSAMETDFLSEPMPISAVETDFLSGPMQEVNRGPDFLSEPMPEVNRHAEDPHPASERRWVPSRSTCWNVDKELRMDRLSSGQMQDRVRYGLAGEKRAEWFMDQNKTELVLWHSHGSNDCNCTNQWRRNWRRV